MELTEAQLRRLFEAHAQSLGYKTSRGPRAYISPKTESLWLGFQLGVMVSKLKEK